MNGIGGKTRLDGTFRTLREQSRKALIIYLMAGDPDVEFTARLVPEIFRAGADIVELGFPFSDPVADGAVIQAAGQRALAGLSALPDFLGLVRNIRRQCDGPLVCMTYYNPIFRYGEERFFADALSAGLDGLIVPDLPLVEAKDWIAGSRKAGIAAIFLEAPNSDDGDARAIAEASQGFIYLVSLKGVTGSDKGLGENLRERIVRMRQQTDTPLAVGFGISTPEQAARIGAMCDGVIVGSGVVSRIVGAGSPDDRLATVLDYIRELRAGLDGAG